MLKSIVDFLRDNGVSVDKASETLKAQAVAEYNAQCWAVFLEYHETSLWAQTKAQTGGPLSIEAVGYMQKEIDARKLRKKLYDDQIAAERAAYGAGKNNVNGEAAHAGKDELHAQNGPDVQRGGQPDDTGHAENHQRPAGEGSEGQGGSRGNTESQQGAGADIPSDTSAGPAAGDS